MRRSEKTKMKTAYNILAVTAIAIVFMLAGLVASLIALGRLNAASAEMIAAAIRGEKLVRETPAEKAEPVTQPSEVPQEPIPAALASVEAGRALLDRERRIIIDMNRRLRDAQLRHIMKSEEFERAVDRFSAERKEQEKTEHDKGFKSALAKYEKIKPQQAKEDFMKYPIEIVVRYLMKMDQRASVKILKEFKTPAEQARRMQIMERIRGTDVEKRSILGGNPTK